MANLPISGLPAAGAIDAADLAVIVQGGVTVQTTQGDLAAFGLLGESVLWHPGFASGRYYQGVMRTAAGANVVLTLNTIQYSPLYVSKPVSIQSFHLKTGSTNAVAGNLNFGIYNAAAGIPTTRLAAIAAAVAIPATANTNINIVPGAAVDLEPGSYFFANQSDASYQLTGNALVAWDGFYMGTTNTAAFFAATSQITGFTEGLAYATGLPATATPVVSTGVVSTAVFRVA